ncbi:MAG: nucleotide exchange factor GrpE, partial [Candidatus Sungiibacteriota bacterium]
MNNDNEEKTEIVPDEEFEAADLSDEALAESDASEKVKKLKDELKKCEAEKKEYLDGWQRSKADFINYKKDEGKRFEDMARFVIAGLVDDILPVLDSFDLALSHGLPAETEKGVLLIRSQFEDVLKKRGLLPITVQAGEKFDPQKHESVGEVESEEAAGAVAEVVQKGYVFQGRVLRPARVRIAKEKK